jgi:hypothetical protein
MSGIAVVDQPTGDRVVIWHVSVGDGLESTMAGAWVLPADDDRIDGLIAGRLLVTTDAAADRFGAGADGGALAAAVQGEVEALDRAFTAHLATLPSSRKLVRPRWPRVPATPTPVTAGDPVASGGTDRCPLGVRSSRRLGQGRSSAPVAPLPAAARG